MGSLNCVFNYLRFAGPIINCQKECKLHCGPNCSEEDCREYLDEMGATGVSDAVWKCCQQRDPQGFSRLVSSCAGTDIGRMLKVPEPSISPIS